MEKSAKSPITINAKDGGEVIIRHGDALPLREPQKVELTGVLSAPREFWEKRKSLFDPNNCYVRFSKVQKKIELVTDEKSVYGDHIIGELITNPELEEFKINKDTRYTMQTLLSLLKMRKFLFANSDSANKLIAGLQKFSVSAQTQIESESNTRGDKRDLTQIKVSSDIALDFTLHMPIFVGGVNKMFNVEICFEVRDRGISLWLESMELKQLEADLLKEMFDTELLAFTEIVCIER